MARAERTVDGHLVATLCTAAFAASALAQPSRTPDHAVARPGCTQEDLPAVEVVLSPQAWSGLGRPTAPYLRFEIAGVPAGEDARLDFTALERRAPGRVARAEWQDASSPRPAWLSGRLTYRQDAHAMSVQGSYRVCGDGGRCVEGSFAAPWRARTARCG